MFAPELYPTFEEAQESTVENPETIEAVQQFLFCIDRWESDSVRLEAAKSLAERLIFLFEREKCRAKDQPA